MFIECDLPETWLLSIDKLGALQSNWAVPNMDATTSGTETIQYCNIPEQPMASALVTSPRPTFQRQVRHCFGDLVPGEFPLAANPSIVLHVLTACNLDPQDLAKLEASHLNHIDQIRIDDAADLNSICCMFYR